MDFLPKTDKSHIVVMNLVDPKAAADDQGRAISSPFQAIDAKTQSLIEIPMTSDTYSQNKLKGAKASISLACLKKTYFRTRTFIDQKASARDSCIIKKYSQSRDLMLFKKDSERVPCLVCDQQKVLEICFQSRWTK